MKMNYKLVTLLCIFLYSDVSGKSVRILGGEVANIRDFPYTVSIRFYPTNVHICAGAIITNRHILTAAHCLHGFKFDWSNLKVFVGSSTLSDKEGTAFLVETITFHPKYNAGLVGTDEYRNDLGTLTEKYGNDMGMITIVGSIGFNEIQNKIALPTADIQVGAPVTICGWGQTTYPQGPFSYQLRKTTANVMRYKDCKIEFPFPLLHDQFCTFRKSFSAGEGDYGGPVVSNGILIGIMSYKVPWFSDAPDMQSNVFRHLDFINSAIK